MEEMNLAITSLVDSLLESFVPKGKPRQEGSSPAWTQELDAMSKIRSRLYHRMTSTRQPTDARRYRTMNHRIKRKYAKEKRRCFKNFSKELDEQDMSSTSRRISGIIKAKARNRSKYGPRQEPDLLLEKFSEFVANKFPPKVPPVRQQHFVVSKKMETYISMAALQAPVGKASGEDGIFAELFRIAPEIWKACGRIAGIPDVWRKFKLVALHKKRLKSDAKTTVRLHSSAI